MSFSEYLLSFFLLIPSVLIDIISCCRSWYFFLIIWRAMILKPSPTLSGPSFVRPSRLRWYLKEESYKCTVIYILLVDFRILITFLSRGIQ